MDDIKYSHRLFYITSGLLLILISVTCCLNMWLIARGISIALYYPFGVGAYFLFLILIIQGFSLIFRSKLYKPKSFIHNFGVTLAFIGALLIYSTVVNMHRESADIFSAYNQSFFEYEPDYFFHEGFINIFQSELGGGFFGTIYAFIFATWVNMDIALMVAIIIASVGTVLTLIKPTIKLIGYLRVKIRNTPKKPKKERKKKETSVDEFDSYVGTNIYAQAKEIGHDEVTVASEVSELAPANFNNRDLSEPSIEFKQNIRQTGVIIRPKFILDDEIEDEVVEPSLPDIKEEIVQEVVAPLPEVAKEEHHEQMNLDFEAPREFNEELLSKMPEMAPLEELPSAPVAEPAPAPIVQPVVNQPAQSAEPVKRKPIHWVPPSTELLSTYAVQEAIDTNTAVAEERKELINQMFSDLHISASCTGYTIGPSITRFHIEYESTGLVKNVANLEKDISRRLSGVPVRFEATVPGFSYSGLEVPNGVVTIVSFKEVFEDLDDVKKHPLNVGFGMDITGKVAKADFNEFPHLLVSGTTGSGKSVFVNSIITTLIMRMSPDDLRICLVDPKRVEMNKYKEIPHLLCPVVNEAREAKVLMTRLVEEMEDRYRRFEIADCATSVKEYNEYAEEHGLEKMYYILAVLDEFADLIDNCKDLMAPVTSLSQKARAAGIHLMIATQRPSVNVLTGTIKANLSTRVALSAAGVQDSLVVLDQGGAESLLGNGDMLVKTPLIGNRNGLTRLQGCYIKGKEIKHVTDYLKEHYPVVYEPKFLNLEEKMEAGANELLGSEKFSEDVADGNEEKYQAIKEWVMSLDYVSMSKIQRECSVGFNRAGRIIKRLQEEEIIATIAEAAAKGFKVLVHDKFNEEPGIVTSSEQEK